MGTNSRRRSKIEERIGMRKIDWTAMIQLSQHPPKQCFIERRSNQVGFRAFQCGAQKWTWGSQ